MGPSGASACCFALTGRRSPPPLTPNPARSSNVVTHGVRIKASALFMPEHPQCFTYSLRMSLVEGEHPDWEECQLFTRDIVLSNEPSDGTAPRVVHGEGVIGQHPVLSDAGYINADRHDYDTGEVEDGEFVYQSCSGHLGADGGFFEGHLDFVPARPPPASIRVAIGKFPLTWGVRGFVY